MDSPATFEPEKRNEGLVAAINLLETMRLRKSELELKVEAIAAQCRLIHASSVQSGSAAEASRLSDAGQLLEQLETRLAVAERVLAHEQDLAVMPHEAPAISEDQVLMEYDQYFGEPKRERALTAR